MIGESAAQPAIVAGKSVTINFPDQESDIEPAYGIFKPAGSFDAKFFLGSPLCWREVADDSSQLLTPRLSDSCGGKWSRIAGIDLSPFVHPAMSRALASFEPVWLDDATGRGAEPPGSSSAPARCM